MPREQEVSLLDSFHALLSELPGVISDRVHLFSLELTQNTQALGKILILLLLSVILAGSAWLALCVGLGTGAIRLGMHWGAVVILEISINLALAYWALSKVINLKKVMGFPVTLRNLTVVTGAGNNLSASAIEQNGEKKDENLDMDIEQERDIEEERESMNAEPILDSSRSH